MRYALYEKEKLQWEMVLCRTENKKSDDFLQDVANAMFMGNNYAPFHTNEHICINGSGIKNDSKMFTLYHNGAYDIWQLGSKVEDMAGFAVPNLYYVRKVGIMFE